MITSSVHIGPNTSIRKKAFYPQSAKIDSPAIGKFGLETPIWAQDRPQSKSQTASRFSIGSAVFAKLTAERPYTLQWAVLSSSKLPLPRGNLDPISDRPTDRQTDHYSVCNNSPHIAYAAMRPNNTIIYQAHPRITAALAARD